MERDLAEIAKDMLNVQLNKNEVDKKRLCSEILSNPNFFMLASENTTEEAQNSGKFFPYINEKGQVILFISNDEGTHFAVRNNILVNGYPMVMKVPTCKVFDIVNEYCGEKAIEEVRIYSLSPISFVCKIAAFISEKTAVGNGKPMDGEDKTGVLQKVDQIKIILDTFDKAERRKLDPALRCENIHQVCLDLISSNRLNEEEIDRALNFQVGFTHRFCTDIVSMEISKEALKKLLDYFGLGGYLYIYKSYCKELMEELKQNPEVDKYTLKPARVSTKEPFELIEMYRGQDELNCAYVYGLTLQSDNRKVRLVISNPSGCVIGWSYDIVGLAPIINQPKAKNEAEAQPELSEARKQEILRNVEKKQSNLIVPSKPGAKLKGTQEEIQAQQDYLIGYFKKRDGINLQAAEQKYKVLVEDPDVLAAFYSYVKDGRWGYLTRHGYTPKRLVQELHYPPYEACCIMIQLQTNTEKMITMLKHRANEPQYRKNNGTEEK